MARLQEINERLLSLEQKVELLLTAHKELQSLLFMKDKELTALRETLSLKEEEIKNFQNQQKITKIVSSIADDTHKQTALKLKINEYIREIDKCIVHLSE